MGEPVMPVMSILFSRPEAVCDAPEPSFFSDLNLDQVLARVAADREQYKLAPFFRVPLHNSA